MGLAAVEDPMAAGSGYFGAVHRRNPLESIHELKDEYLQHSSNNSSTDDYWVNAGAIAAQVSASRSISAQAALANFEGTSVPNNIPTSFSRKGALRGRMAAADLEDDDFFHEKVTSTKGAAVHQNNELTNNNDCVMQEMSFAAENLSTYHGAAVCHQDFSLQENNPDIH